MKRLLVCLILLVGGVVQAQCPDVDNTTDVEAQRKAQAAYDKADAARNEASSAQCLSQEVLDNIKGLDSYLLGRMVALRQAGEITIASVYERKLNAIQARVGRVAFLIEAQANIRYNDATEVINAAQAALMAADWTRRRRSPRRQRRRSSWPRRTTTTGSSS